MTGQAIIPVNTLDEYTLSEFAGRQNSTLVRELDQLCNDSPQSGMIFFWGPGGSGKTHLLYAVYSLARSRGKMPVYMNLQDQAGSLAIAQELINEAGTKISARVCVDNLECLEGSDALQQMLFGLYEKIVPDGGAFAACASRPLAELKILLKDLASRLAAGGVYRVHEPEDTEKKAALKQRASNRGFRLNDHVVDYMLTRYSRDTASLFQLLDRLDDASLRNHRRITIPFVKNLLGD